jgi:hypothetical protein
MVFSGRLSLMASSCADSVDADYGGADGYGDEYHRAMTPTSDVPLLPHPQSQQQVHLVSQRSAHPSAPSHVSHTPTNDIHHQSHTNPTTVSCMP